MTRPRTQSGSRSSGTSRDSHSRNPRVSPQHPNEASNPVRTTSYNTQVIDQHPGFYGYVFEVRTPAARSRYDPQQDKQYFQVPRTPLSDYSQLHRVINEPALNMAPIPARHQNLGAPVPNAHCPNYITDRSPPQEYFSSTRFSTFNLFGNRSTAAETNGPRLTIVGLEAHERHQRPIEPPLDTMEAREREDPRSVPYDAVGYIRRDEGVYDIDEVYEEYRE